MDGQSFMVLFSLSTMLGDVLMIKTVEEVSNTILTTLVLAVLGWAWVYVRNWKFERSLKSSLSHHGHAYSPKHGVGIVLLNKNGYSVEVRALRAKYATISTILLNPIGSDEELASGPIILAPFSQGRWFFPPWNGGFYSGVEQFEVVEIEFLYPTLFGGKKLVTVKGNSSDVEFLNKQWQEFKAKISQT